MCRQSSRRSSAELLPYVFLFSSQSHGLVPYFLYCFSSLLDDGRLSAHVSVRLRPLVCSFTITCLFVYVGTAEGEASWDFMSHGVPPPRVSKRDGKSPAHFWSSFFVLRQFLQAGSRRVPADCPQSSCRLSAEFLPLSVYFMYKGRLGHERGVSSLEIRLRSVPHMAGSHRSA